MTLYILYTLKIQKLNLLLNGKTFVVSRRVYFKVKHHPTHILRRVSQMKIYLFLGLVLLSVSIFTLINSEHDNLLVPIINITLALLLLKLGFSTLKGKHRQASILLLIASGLLFIFTLAKLLFN